MQQHHPTRHPVTFAAATCVEQLEQRTLLSGVFDISKVAAFHPTSADIHDPKNGPLGNAGVHLTNLYSEYKTFIRKGGSPRKFKSEQETHLQYKKNSVAVTIRTFG